MSADRSHLKILAKNISDIPLECLLVSNGKHIEVEIITYNNCRARLRALGIFKLTQDANSFLKFKIGITDIEEKIFFRVLMETIIENGEFVVEFTSESIDVLTRAEKAFTCLMRMITVTTVDPLEANRSIHFNVLNINLNGMLLSTSMENKHLFPGMDLKAATFTIPGIGECRLNLFLENSRLDGKNAIQFSTTTRGALTEYHSLISRHLSNLGLNSAEHEDLHRVGILNRIQTITAFFRTIKMFSKRRNRNIHNNSNINIKKVGSSDTGADPKYTQQHINATVMKTYILQAKDLIGKSNVEEILFGFGLTESYFENLGNWVSVQFFDEFIDKFAKHGDVSVLNRTAGLRTASREILGYNYYIVKSFFSPKIVFKVFEKYLSKLNRTFKYDVLKLDMNSATIRVGQIDKSFVSKHPAVVENWMGFTESYIRASTGRSVKSTLNKSIYNGDPYTEFTIKWENPVYVKKYVFTSIIFIGFAYLFLKTRPDYLSLTSELAFYLALSMTILGTLFTIRHFQKRYTEIHESFVEFERQSDMKYKELQTSKTILEKSYQEGVLLETLNREIQISDNVTNILQYSLESLCTQFGFKRSFIMIKDEDVGKVLRTVAVFGEEKSLQSIWGFVVDVSVKRDNPLVLSSVFHSGQSLLINNVEEHKFQLNDASRALVDQLATKAFTIVPIPSGNCNWGVLIADKGETESTITRDDLIVLQRLCQSIGLALDKRAKMDLEIRTRSIFQKFVPSGVVESTLGQKEFKLGGETRDAICLFMDIRNFTSLASEMPPTVLIDVLNKIFTLLQVEVNASGGVIDKYLGDGALVTWGAVPGSAAHGHSAISCAQKFLVAVDNMNEDLTKHGIAPIEVGIGIHRGTVIAGNIGSNERAEFTVIGSPVNLASRLEQLTKTLTCHIAITDQVMDFSKLPKDWRVYHNVEIRGLVERVSVATFRHESTYFDRIKSA